MSNIVLQKNLFGQPICRHVRTEGIKYIGSKLRLVPQILNMASRLGVQTVFDGFTGSTGCTGFSKAGYAVHSSDISEWSDVFAGCYLGAHPDHDYSKLIGELNRVRPIDGWFTDNYGGDPDCPSAGGLKKPWQKKNTRRLDGIRTRIDELSLAPHEKAVALTSLLLALDKTDSTIGHFASYLNGWSARSYKDLVLQEPAYAYGSTPHHHTKGDIFSIIDKADPVDLAYLDPPYGSNNEKMPPSRVRYAAYYHIWTTICLNDRPKLFGKALRREEIPGTRLHRQVLRNSGGGKPGSSWRWEAIERLIKSINARYVMLSYKLWRTGHIGRAC